MGKDDFQIRLDGHLEYSIYKVTCTMMQKLRAGGIQKSLPYKACFTAVAILYSTFEIAVLLNKVIFVGKVE